MGVIDYLRIVLRYWWLILGITLLSLTVTMIFTYNQTPIYRATSTYVTKLSTGNSGGTDSTILGLDTLMRQQRIFVTYCDIFKSQSVRTRAYEIMDIDPIANAMEKYTVNCNVFPESNVLSVSITGMIPPVVQQLNQAIGLSGVERINSLYQLFPIELLDPVFLEEDPISPSYTFNLVLGVVFGLIVGVGTVFVLEFFRNPLRDIQQLSIRDVRFNLYNNRYFQDRLGQEITRSKMRSRPLTLLYIRLIPNEDFALLQENIQESLFRRAALLIEDNLREGDIMSHLRDNIFQILLPETPGDEALDLIRDLIEIVRQTAIEAGMYKSYFALNAGLVESSGGMLDSVMMGDEAEKALRNSDNSGRNLIKLTRTTPRPFVFGEVEPTTFEDERNMNANSDNLSASSPFTDGIEVLPPVSNFYEEDKVSESSSIFDDSEGEKR